MTAEALRSRNDINLEIKRLKAQLNQYREDPTRRQEIQNQIEELMQKRNELITSTQIHKITHERLAQAAETFEAKAVTRKDIDD